jgi:glycerophosphoryl diester phosphodiesterase
MPSFQRAADEGVDVLELDVRLSADGELVVIHDPTVDRTTDGQGSVAELTWAQLRELDAGHRFNPGGGYPRRGRGVRIPLLTEVLESFPDHLFTVELKEVPQPDVVPRVLEVLRRLVPGRAILASFSQDLLRQVRRLAPDIPTNLSNAEIRRFVILGWIGLAGWVRSPGCVLQVPTHSNHEQGTGIRVVTPRLIRAAHRSGRSVQVWTINDPAEMRELIALGVDGITTDRPDLLNQVLEPRDQGA